MFYRLYLIIDLFSRKIVGWEIWETEEAKYAEELMKKTVISEKINGRPLVLHSDNGSPMKAVSIADRLSRQCGFLSHCLRIFEPVSAEEWAIRTEFVPMAA